MRRILRENGLSLVLLILFLASLVGQALTGWHQETDDLVAHDEAAIALGDYLTSPDFLSVTMENWESEFLQMAAFLILGTKLYQKGSAESRDPDAGEEPPPPLTWDSPGPARKGGWVKKVYQYSLSLTFLALFAVSFFLHLKGSTEHHNAEAVEHHTALHSLGEHLASSAFWFESFQNWQSEFLAVLAMVGLSIWLRQDGSPESKHVNDPHDKTGTSG